MALEKAGPSAASTTLLAVSPPCKDGPEALTLDSLVAPSARAPSASCLATTNLEGDGRLLWQSPGLPRRAVTRLRAAWPPERLEFANNESSPMPFSAVSDFIFSNDVTCYYGIDLLLRSVLRPSLLSASARPVSDSLTRGRNPGPCFRHLTRCGPTCVSAGAPHDPWSTKSCNCPYALQERIDQDLSENPSYVASANPRRRSRRRRVAHDGRLGDPRARRATTARPFAVRRASAGAGAGCRRSTTRCRTLPAAAVAPRDLAYHSARRRRPSVAPLSEYPSYPTTTVLEPRAPEAVRDFGATSPPRRGKRPSAWSRSSTRPGSGRATSANACCSS